MSHSASRVQGFVCAVFALGLFLVPVAPSQALEEKAALLKMREAIAKDLTALEAAIKEKLPKEQIRLIRSLVPRWKHFDKKQRKLLRADMEKLFAKGAEDLRLTIVRALGRMDGGKKGLEAKKSTHTLLKYLKVKKVVAKGALHREILKSLGLLKRAAGMAALLDSLNDKETKTVTAAIQSLGQFHKAKTSVRKEIFKTILRAIPSPRTSGGNRGGGAGGRSGGLVDPRFDYERKRKIESAADATFRKLTGEQLRGKEAWMRWWNKKGKKKSKW